jgi:uncharacterized protein YcaQ
MSALRLTRKQARRFLLAHQGLWPPREMRGKGGVRKLISRVGCVQFDPLDIVGRNPELILQARVSDFRPAMLRELLYEDRVLVDGWDKMMSIYPTTDWPYFSRHREAARSRLRGGSSAIEAVLPLVRQAIEERGPLSSIDLGFDQIVDWPWAPTRVSRAALESMYFWGELVIHHKVHTRKVYDFSRRHIPQRILCAVEPNPTEEQYHDWRVLRRIAGVGILWNRSGESWLGIEGMKSAERSAAIARLLRRGLVREVHVEGIGVPLYMRRRDKKNLQKALSAAVPKPRAAIVAPLDNLLWDRRLVRELFGFDYRWEVYKPVHQRRHGYYVLPVLHGDRFVARFEPGRDKTDRTLLIKNWWWETDVRQSERLKADLAACMKAFLGYMDIDELRIDKDTVRRESLDWLARGAL